MFCVLDSFVVEPLDQRMKCCPCDYINIELDRCKKNKYNVLWFENFLRLRKIGVPCNKINDVSLFTLNITLRFFLSWTSRGYFHNISCNTSCIRRDKYILVYKEIFVLHILLSHYVKIKYSWSLKLKSTLRYNPQLSPKL